MNEKDTKNLKNAKHTKKRETEEARGEFNDSYIGALQFQLKLQRDLISLQLRDFVLEARELRFDASNDLVGLQKLRLQEADVLLHGIGLGRLGVQGEARLGAPRLEFGKLLLQVRTSESTEICLKKRPNQQKSVKKHRNRIEINVLNEM